MNTWRRLRKWANRDDGKYYRIGNYDLNWKETVGWLLIILACIIYLLHQNGNFETKALRWTSLAAGIGFIVWGGWVQDEGD